VLTTSKRPRDEAYVLEDQEAVLPGTPSSSAPAASASEYQPSVLSRTSGNKRISTGKHRATGKENAIFKNNASAHTPGPRGKNKRTLDDQVNLTMSAPSVKFTNRAGIQEERRTRQFTKKHTETTLNE
jgi:hypothetical protein